MSYLDSEGLLYFWQKIKNKFVAQETGKGLSTNDFTTDEKNKLKNVEESANKYVLPTADADTLGGIKVGKGLSVSGGVLSLSDDGTLSWANVSGKPTTVSGYGITDVYTKDQVDAKITSVLKPGGSFTFASLPTPGASNLGFVYNVSDAFTTTDAFIEGAGEAYPAGTNVAVVLSGTSYVFDVMSGFVDLSGYVKSADMAAISNADIDTIVA
jgi:hypothetical protein